MQFGRRLGVASPSSHRGGLQEFPPTEGLLFTPAQSAGVNASQTGAQSTSAAEQSAVEEALGRSRADRLEKAGLTPEEGTESDVREELSPTRMVTRRDPRARPSIPQPDRLYQSIPGMSVPGARNVSFAPDPAARYDSISAVTSQLPRQTGGSPSLGGPSTRTEGISFTTELDSPEAGGRDLRPTPGRRYSIAQVIDPHNDSLQTVEYTPFDVEFGVDTNPEGRQNLQRLMRLIDLEVGKEPEGDFPPWLKISKPVIPGKYNGEDNIVKLETWLNSVLEYMATIRVTGEKYDKDRC